MKGPLDQEILDGNRRAAARLMRLIDDRAPQATELLTALLPHTGAASIIGITGNPGSGKSTLTNQLISGFRSRGQTVACIAIDPTSPFSGGAILGDRVRMQDHAGDDGVFIRSVATRGHTGGLSRSTPAMVQVFDAMGFDTILIETVGVGQDEIEIVRLADASLVVMVPGLGDDVQADKAGLMEIADVFVLNKSDRPGARSLRRQLQTTLSLNDQTGSERLRPPICPTNALDGSGVTELMEAIDAVLERTFHHQSRETRMGRRYTHLVRAIAQTEMDARFDRTVNSSKFETLIQEVLDATINPYDAGDRLVQWLADDEH